MVSKLSKNDMTEYMNKQYDALRSKLADSRASERLTTMADQYTSAIYGVRDQIARRLDGTSVKKVSNEAYQMVCILKSSIHYIYMIIIKLQLICATIFIQWSNLSHFV